ncbi:MFS transporter [Rhizohabitans arisaemae]|uniref:MFS transporter n=1 Tax=Rhizohabitans arisaemae TaxID=2720610 RepID=UPI0024B0FC07|nr:MFS transporter [Rhizohabitans arisaemae]
MRQNTDSPPAKRPLSARRVVAACMAGTTIEWYDFYIYGMAAALVFGPQYFPSLSPLAGTLAAFGTFAVGFGARPLGGIVLGHFGDRIGRKSILVWSLLLMGGSTFAIGLLPTYEQIGIWAPILLVTLRFLQGAGLGGEWGGAALMAVEHAPPNKRGLYGSFISMGIPAGLVLSNLVFLVMAQVAPGDSFATWGWRVPFLLSIVLVLVGLWVRLGVEESPLFKQSQHQKKAEKEQSLPIATVLRRYPKQVALAAGTYIGNSGVGYIVIVYLLTYGTTVLKLPRQQILTYILISMATMGAAIIAAAILSDRYGRRRVSLAGAVLSVMWAAVFFPLVDTGQGWAILLAVIGMNSFSGILFGPQAALFAELFSTEVRYSGISIGYQLGALLGGALAPITATALYGLTGTSQLITIYMVGICVISLACFLGLTETRRRDLSADPAEEPQRTPPKGDVVPVKA